MPLNKGNDILNVLSKEKKLTTANSLHLTRRLLILRKIIKKEVYLAALGHYLYGRQGFPFGSFDLLFGGTS